MNIPLGIDSIALFGSHVRGDADELSDQDILLLGKESLRVGTIDLYRQLGYSPSFYSWNQLDCLMRQGSLFLQHIKQESKILVDKNGRLEAKLALFTPSSDSSKKLIENAKLFQLTFGVPDRPYSAAWAFDVLAVVFRNFAVAKSAEKGRYIFAYSALIEDVAFTHSLSSDEVNLLLALRGDKARYRRGYFREDTDFQRLLKTQCLLARLLGVAAPRGTLTQQLFVSLCLTELKIESWYLKLRKYEGAYRAQGNNPNQAETNSAKELEAYFSGPSPYSSSQPNIPGRVLQLLKASHEKPRVH